MYRLDIYIHSSIHSSIRGSSIHCSIFDVCVLRLRQATICPQVNSDPFNNGNQKKTFKSPIPLRVPIPTQPLSIPPETSAQQTHNTLTTHVLPPHHHPHPLDSTPGVIFFLLNLALVLQSHSINFQTTQHLRHTPYAFHLQRSITKTPS